MWDTQCKHSFQIIKEKLTTALVLVLPNPREPFEVYYDASKMGLGGVLMQLAKLWPMLLDNLRLMRGIIPLMTWS